MYRNFKRNIFQIHELQSTSKFFEHLRKFLSKNSYLMQFYEINNCQVMIFKFYAVHNKHEMIKMGNQTKEKCHVLSLLLE